MNSLKQDDPDGWRCLIWTCKVAVIGFFVALALVLGWCWIFGFKSLL